MAKKKRSPMAIELEAEDEQHGTGMDTEMGTGMGRVAGMNSHTKRQPRFSFGRLYVIWMARL